MSAAALVLDRQPADAQARYFGLPVAVTRAVPLRRDLSDDDWERLVAELRDTFAARGRTTVSGARREWRVGNLRVTHESTGNGALLELRTRKGDVRAFLRIGVALLVVAAASLVVALMGADVGGGGDAAGARRLTTAGLLAAAGVGMVLVGALRLPAWARERARQFEALAAYARRIAAS